MLLMLFNAIWTIFLSNLSNDCEPPSDSDNIATRVKAKYSKARQKKIHKKSQELLRVPEYTPFFKYTGIKYTKKK